MLHNIAREVQKLADDLGVDRKRSIGEVAKELKVETHVIRFWEENFPQIKPEIGAGKRRYYYNKQLKILKRIKKFLYEEGYTVAGLQKLLKIVLH
jgi:DNA-binding transcriptional MerR regulator